MATPIRIAAAQMDIVFANREANLTRMMALTQTAASEGAALIVFPECALAGYCFENLEEARPHAETIPGNATQRMTQVCQANNCHVVFVWQVIKNTECCRAHNTGL